MNIGFDLDGVVVEQQLGILRIIDILGQEHKDELMQYYCSSLKTQLNPLDYIADNDKLFFITGRSKAIEDITKYWATKYFPTATVYVTCNPTPNKEDEVINWSLLVAKNKSKYIIENNIEVFFEDNPTAVKYLRELCPNCKVIQYSSRLLT